MTVDDTNSYLVTGDADGVIKVWDISEYCVGCMAEDDNPPREYHLDCGKTSLQQQNVYQTVEVFHALNNKNSYKAWAQFLPSFFVFLLAFGSDC